MARSIESIQADIAQQERDIKMYQDLLKGGTVQTGSVSAGRYKGYIVDRKDEIKRLKQELAEAKKVMNASPYSNGVDFKDPEYQRLDKALTEADNAWIRQATEANKAKRDKAQKELSTYVQKMKAQNSFSNGRLKAEQAITNKMQAAGLGEI